MRLRTIGGTVYWGNSPLAFSVRRSLALRSALAIGQRPTSWSSLLAESAVGSWRSTAVGGFLVAGLSPHPVTPSTIKPRPRTAALPEDSSLRVLFLLMMSSVPQG